MQGITGHQRCRLQGMDNLLPGPLHHTRPVCRRHQRRLLRCFGQSD